MATFIWIPASGAAQTTKPDVSVIKYGDGYEQRVPKGINNIADKWALKFSTNVSDVESFLRGHGGQLSFNWTNPLGVTGTYVCREWKVNHLGGLVFDLTCEFEQVFE